MLSSEQSTPRLESAKLLGMRESLIVRSLRICVFVVKSRLSSRYFMWSETSSQSLKATPSPWVMDDPLRKLNNEDF